MNKRLTNKILAETEAYIFHVGLVAVTANKVVRVKDLKLLIPTDTSANFAYVSAFISEN
jgi:hypothetical protein